MVSAYNLSRIGYPQIQGPSSVHRTPVCPFSDRPRSFERLGGFTVYSPSGSRYTTQAPKPSQALPGPTRPQAPGLLNPGLIIAKMARETGGRPERPAGETRGALKPGTLRHQVNRLMCVVCICSMCFVLCLGWDLYRSHGVIWSHRNKQHVPCHKLIICRGIDSSWSTLPSFDHALSSSRVVRSEETHWSGHTVISD